MFLDRLHRLQAALASARLNGIAAIAGPNLYYLTGLSFHLSERPAVGFFPVTGDPVMVAPVLEETKIISGTPYPMRVFSYDDVEGPAGAFRQAAQALGGGALRLGVEFGRMRVMELRWVEAAFSAAQIEPAELVLAGLRMAKDEAELAHMRRATVIAEQALAATLPSVKAGVTERELAAELVTQMLRAGSDPEFPFAPIVASGPNAALPHAWVTDRKLQAGDLLIIDWGAVSQGYVSDLTRTFAVGAVEPEFLKIFEAVKAANAAGKAAARPGVTCASVDAAARRVIAEAGYGDFFTHRVGHGLGLEGHEMPSVHAENQMLLKPGMTFTIEPGIYLAGKGGVRIEDDVVITADGCESLSVFPRDWQALPPA
jgi:Xaa-Pro dipeptidase